MMVEEAKSGNFEFESLSSLSHNERLDYLFNQVYYTVIIEHVKFVEVQTHVTCMRQHAGEILAVDRQKGPRHAAVTFMEHLKSVRDEGKYEELLQALKQFDYQIVVNAIDKGEIQHDHDEHKKLLEILYSKLINSIAMETPEIAVQLYQKGVISSEERQRICNMSEREPFSALFQLVDDMPRKNIKWFEIFLETLYSFEKWELCELLHEKWFNKKRRADSQYDSDNSDSGIPQEIESSGDEIRQMYPIPAPVSLSSSISSSEKPVGTSSSPQFLQIPQISNLSPSKEEFSGCQCGPILTEMQNQIKDLCIEVKRNSEKLDEVMSLLKNSQS